MRILYVCSGSCSVFFGAWYETCVLVHMYYMYCAFITLLVERGADCL